MTSFSVEWLNGPRYRAVYGWLSLDRRGQWLIKGERISNPTVTAFIGRNYERDERGCWFFQNGPQRVFVELDYAPLVLRVCGAQGAALEFEAHTGKRVATVEGAWLDEDGSLLLSTNLGPGWSTIVTCRSSKRLSWTQTAIHWPRLCSKN
jgi:hypothetical protein